MIETDIDIESQPLLVDLQESSSRIDERRNLLSTVKKEERKNHCLSASFVMGLLTLLGSAIAFLVFAHRIISSTKHDRLTNFEFYQRVWDTTEIYYLNYNLTCGTTWADWHAINDKSCDTLSRFSSWQNSTWQDSIKQFAIQCYDAFSGYCKSNDEYGATLFKYRFLIAGVSLSICILAMLSRYVYKEQREYTNADFKQRLSSQDAAKATTLFNTFKTPLPANTSLSTLKQTLLNNIHNSDCRAAFLSGRFAKKTTSSSFFSQPAKTPPIRSFFEQDQNRDLTLMIFKEAGLLPSCNKL